MTLGQVDDDTGDDDPTMPTTTLPTTGISASASNGEGDSEADVGDTQGSTTDGDSTSSADTDSTTGDATTAVTASDTGDTSEGVTSDGRTTDDGGTTDGGTTTDATTEGCDHPSWVFGDCLNFGFSACMFDQGGSCLHDGEDPPTVGVCSVLDCVDVCDCPAAPATGNAQVVCGFLQGLPSDACYLACGAATTCPDGMICHNNTLCTFPEL